MAFTKLQTKKFIETTESGVTSKTQKPVKPGATMPVFIPRLMPYMTKGAPVTQSVVTNGNMVFVNDTSCKPNAPVVVKTQNFLSPKFASNGSWASVVEDETKDNVPAGTSVQITFPSGNILSPTFTVG